MSNMPYTKIRVDGLTRQLAKRLGRYNEFANEML